jgi:hypothetical protein
LAHLLHFASQSVEDELDTLAYANEHRPWELYQTLFKCQELAHRQGGGKKFRFKN